MPEELDNRKKPKTTLIKHKKVEEEAAPVVQEEPEPLGAPVDETDTWLRELIEQERVAGSTTEENQFAAEAGAGEFTEPDTDMPDWLNKMDAIARTPEETQPIAPIRPQESEIEASDLPDWLRGLDEEQKWAAPASINDELPAWLQGEPEPPAQPEAAILNKEEVMLMEYSFSQRAVASPRGLAL